MRITTTTGSGTASWGQAAWDVDESTLQQGAVPAAGSWTRLEVPLDALALGGTLTRIDIAHVDGRVWFDRIALWPLFGARLTSFSSSHESTVAVGTTVTWTATATGTVYPLQYRFERRNPLGDWSVVQNYGSMNTYTWTPTAADVGGNAIRVSVRNGGSQADFEDTATLGVRIVEGEGGGDRMWRGDSEVRLEWWKRWRTAPPVALGVHPGALATTTGAHPRRHSVYTPELQLLAETEISTASKPPIQYEYVWFGGQPLAQIATATGDVHWYFNDHLGTPFMQTTANAAIVWRAEYDPYGTIATYRTGADKHQPLRFPGQEAEQGTDVAYNIFRWYRSGWGRYTQSDPLDNQIAGVINGYRYALSNPLRWIDPSGLESAHPSDRINCIANPIDCARIYKCKKEATTAAKDKFTYDKDGTPQNAYKHCYWNCCMTKIIGAVEAKKFGDAHENFSRNNTCEKEMDLWNNEQGRKVTGSTTCDSHCGSAPLQKWRKCQPCGFNPWDAPKPF